MTIRKSVTSRRVQAVLLTLGLLHSAAFAATPAPEVAELSGRLTENSGVPVLELWGDAEQAAFAHGYLVGETYAELMDEFVLSDTVLPDPQVYEMLVRPRTLAMFVWPEATERELAALTRGATQRANELAAARGDELRGVWSRKLQRTLTVEDLKVANTLADWFGFFCSSVTVWGDRAQGGAPITARNLDFPNTPALAKRQIVCIRRGHDGQRGWIGVTWPGLIGVYTAMNDDGVTISMHDSNGLPPARLQGLTPRSIALRLALERASAEDAFESIAGVLRRHAAIMGNNIHVSRPRVADGPPAVIIEYDGAEQGGGVTLRRAAADASSLFCTNHFRSRREPVECDRYQTLQRGLEQAERATRALDAAAALELVLTARQRTTLHTVVFEPQQRRLWARIPAVTDEIVEFTLAAPMASRNQRAAGK